MIGTEKAGYARSRFRFSEWRCMHDDPAGLFGRAVQSHLQGRFGEALALYDAALRGNPGMAAAHSNRGLLLQALNRFDEALQCFGRAIELQPNYADAHYNRGIALRCLGRMGEAIRAYDHAIRIQPHHPEAWNNRGIALRLLERPDEALESFTRAIALRQNFAQAHYNRGDALQDLRRHTDAVSSYDHALALKPDFAAALNNRANALRILERPEDALASCDKAITCDPRSAESWNSRGNALKDLARFDEAIASYDRAITLRAEYADALWNKSLCVLLMGNWEAGWRLYEWRKLRTGAAVFPQYPQPLWSGAENLEGKTLLIHAEQGLGDTLQFCRYAAMAAMRCKRVILAVQDSLVCLLRDLAPGVEVIGLSAPLPEFDNHIPLLSLPMAFQTNPDSCPHAVPYLHAEPDRIAMWKSRLDDAFRIGICWQGSRQGEIDIGRSFPLRALESLASVPGVRLVSLQKHDGVEQLRDRPTGLEIEILGGNFDGGPDAFVDAAAVIANLDLVVTCDTAIAHLAGALGRPVWVALKHVPDWRWLLGRRDSPWYPTMELFRQPGRGDWQSVFATMRHNLIKLLTARSAGREAING